MASITQYSYQFGENDSCYILLKKDTGLEKAYGPAPTSGTQHKFLLVQSKNKNEGGIRARYGVWHAEVAVSGRNPLKMYKRIPILSKAGAQAFQAQIDAKNYPTTTIDGLTWTLNKVRPQVPEGDEVLGSPPAPNP